MVGVPQVQGELENLGVGSFEHRCGGRESCLRDKHMVARSGLCETPLQRAHAHANELGGHAMVG
jgi:hypothetical protein